MHIQRSRGFTLIELLVVIAIIGILSAVVLASLNTARSKGNDAAIKSNLDTIRTQSAIYYDSNNSYSTGVFTGVSAAPTAAACALGASLFTDSNVAAAMLAAAKAAGDASSVTMSNETKVLCQIANGTATSPGTTITAAAPATVWTVWAPTTTGTGWCVDSAGNSRASAAPASGTVSCP